MPKLKIATFNVEWMISVFGGVWKTWDGTIPATFPGKSLGGLNSCQSKTSPVSANASRV